MTNQAEKKQAIFNKVFHPVTVLKARMLYEACTDKYLVEFQEARSKGDVKRVEAIEKQLTILSKNMSELEHVEVPEFSFGEVIHLTAPVRVVDVKKKLALHDSVFSEKNVKNALSLYQGFVDVHLDQLNLAIAQNDTTRISDLKSELDELRKNIQDLQKEGVLK